MTTDLPTFLLARLAEDEAVARAAVGKYRSESWHLGRYDETVLCFPPSSPEKVAWNLEHNGPERAAEHAEWGGFVTDDQTAPHIARHDPARVLAEVAAKRAIVASLDLTPCPCQTSSRCVIHDSSAGPPEFARERYVDFVTEVALRHLASVYTDHPDYDERWRP